MVDNPAQNLPPLPSEPISWPTGSPVEPPKTYHEIEGEIQAREAAIRERQAKLSQEEDDDEYEDGYETNDWRWVTALGLMLVTLAIVVTVVVVGMSDRRSSDNRARVHISRAQACTHAAPEDVRRCIASDL